MSQQEDDSAPAGECLPKVFFALQSDVSFDGRRDLGKAQGFRHGPADIAVRSEDDPTRRRDADAQRAHAARLRLVDSAFADQPHDSSQHVSQPDCRFVRQPAKNRPESANQVPVKILHEFPSLCAAAMKRPLHAARAVKKDRKLPPVLVRRQFTVFGPGWRRLPPRPSRLRDRRGNDAKRGADFRPVRKAAGSPWEC